MSSSNEEKLISAVLRTGDLSTALQAGIEPETMTTLYDEWSWLTNYYNEHGRLPSRVAFRSTWPDVTLVKADDVAYFANEVRQERARGLLAQAVDDVVGQLQDGYSAEQIVADLQHSLGDVERISAVSKVLSLPHDHQAVLDDLKATQEHVRKHGDAGVPTGFNTLDTVTGGGRPGELWIVGARLGSYKSTTLMRMAIEASRAGKNVIFVALEMSRIQVNHKIHVMLSHMLRREGKSAFVLDPADLRSGNVSLSGYRAWLKKAEKELLGRIDIVDGSHGSVGTAQLRGFLEREKYDAAYLDYLTLFRANVSKQAADWQAVAQLTSDFKGTAIQYELPIFTASQLNRAEGRGSGKFSSYMPPSPESLSRSDSVGQDADYVILQGKASQHAVRMKMAKSRHTEEGFTWWVHADIKTGTYEEVDQRTIDKVLTADEDAMLEGKTGIAPRKRGAPVVSKPKKGVVKTRPTSTKRVVKRRKATS